MTVMAPRELPSERSMGKESAACAGRSPAESVENACVGINTLAGKFSPFSIESLFLKSRPDALVLSGIRVGRPAITEPRRLCW